MSRVVEPALLISAADRLGIERTRFTQLSPIVRDRSVVTPLAVDGVIVAWHKMIRSGGDAPGELDESTARDRLARAEACTSAVNRAFRRDSIDAAIAPILALDLDTLCVVTGHVDGTPLRVPPMLLTRWPSTSADQLRLVGRTFALIDLSLPVLSDSDSTDAEARLRVPFEMLRRQAGELGLHGSDVDRLGDRVDRAVTIIRAEGFPASYAHGDASATNLRVVGRKIGLIDADWPCRLAGFDLATISVRLELAASRMAGLGRWMTARMVEGYADLAPIGPGYQFERLQRYVRLLAGGQLPTRFTRGVAIRYLKSEPPDS